MFQSPLGGVPNTGYPALAAGAPPNPYGVVNPGPDAGQVQSNGTGIASGPLFGERTTSVSDASLFQPNISPDVVTVAVTVPTLYFQAGIKELHIPQGTIVYLAKDSNLQNNKHLSRATRDTGCIHKALFGVFPRVNREFAQDDIDRHKGTLRGFFPTVCVGPVNVVKNRIAYMAVAIQNVCHVSTANLESGLARANKPIGQKLYFEFNDKFPTVTQTPQATTKPTRELTLVLPADPVMLGTVSCDLGRMINMM